MAKLPHQSSVPPVDPQDGAIKSDGGAAESLQTTTTDVVVSGAATPTTGQVLTAVDGVSADWQTPAAGGAPAPVNASVVNTKSANFYDTDDQFASVADPGVFHGLAAMTVECWFALDTINSGYYGFCGQAGVSDADVAFTLRASNTGVLTAVFSTNGGVTSQELTFSHGALVGEWHHVAVTWDGATGNASAYIDGVLVSGPTALLAGTIYNSTAAFYIGRFSATDFNYEHNGRLSELRIWGVVRTASQIIDSMYGVAKGNEDGLVTVHHLSEGWRDTGPNSSVHLTPGVNAPTFVEDLPFGLHTVSPTRSAAQNTQSYNFVGAGDDYLYLTNPGIFGGHSALSIECWIKPSSTLVNFRGICAQDTVFRINAISATQIEVGFSTNGTITLYNVTPGWTIGEWTHLACTWDGVTGAMKTYVNGVLTGGTGVGQKGKTYVATTQFTIGIAQGILEGWDGNISEFRIWSTERNENQILDSMYGAMTGGEEGLIVLYHFNGDYRDSGPLERVLTVGNAPVLSGDVPYGSYAQKLLHASGAIDGSAAAAPTAGQVATAIDANTFDWQDPAGGGSDPVTSAQGDYIQVSMSGDMTASFTVNDPILFDTVESSRGEMAVDGVTNVGRISGLKAGRTYKIEGNAPPRLSGTLVYSWRDITNAEWLGNSAVNASASHAQNQGDSPIATFVFTPTVDTEIELQLTGFSGNINVMGVDSAAPNNPAAWARVIEIGAVQADVVGGLEFMDIITVDSPTASVSFGASGDGAFQRPLDGDVDQVYIIGHRVIKTSTVTTVDVKPNGIGTNQVSKRVTMESSFGTFTRMVLAQPGALGFELGTTEFDAVSGRERGYHTVASLQNADPATTAGQFGRTYSGTWDDLATVITSLEFATDDASLGIDIGSEFVLYRRTRTNLRADSAAVYERMTMETVDPGAIATTERTVGHTIYGGSVVGVSARVEDAVTAGSITVNVKVDGVTKLTAVLDTTNSISHVVREAVGVHKFAADENVSVEFVPSSYDNSGSLASAVTVQVHLTNDALITQNDRVVAKTILTTNEQSIVLNGLDGDADGVYEITGRLLLTTASHNVQIRPNAETANLLGSIHNEIGVTEETVWRLHTSGGATGYLAHFFKMTLYAARTMNGATVRRRYHLEGQRDAENFSNLMRSGGRWDDNTDNLASLTFICTVASGILAGSEIVVRRIKA